MRFLIENEFLDKTSRCWGFYPYTGKFVRHQSDRNPIIWVNIAQSGITLWGKDAKVGAPFVSDQCLNDSLLLRVALTVGALGTGLAIPTLLLRVRGTR
jgi:hypothetical protein